AFSGQPGRTKRCAGGWARRRGRGPRNSTTGSRSRRGTWSCASARLRDLSVGLDASVIFSSVGGTRVYATQLLNSLLEARPSWTFFLYPRNQNQATATAKQVNGDGLKSISDTGA